MLEELLEYMEQGKVYSTVQLAGLIGKNEDFIKAGLCYLEEKRYIRSVKGMDCKTCKRSCKGCQGRTKMSCSPVLWEVAE